MRAIALGAAYKEEFPGVVGIVGQVHAGVRQEGVADQSKTALINAKISSPIVHLIASTSQTVSLNVNSPSTSTMMLLEVIK